jgi:hypothetical protein
MSYKSIESECRASHMSLLTRFRAGRASTLNEGHILRTRDLERRIQRSRTRKSKPGLLYSIMYKRKNTALGKASESVAFLDSKSLKALCSSKPNEAKNTRRVLSRCPETIEEKVEWTQMRIQTKKNFFFYPSPCSHKKKRTTLTNANRSNSNS